MLDSLLLFLSPSASDADGGINSDFLLNFENRKMPVYHNLQVASMRDPTFARTLAFIC